MTSKFALYFLRTVVTFVFILLLAYIMLFIGKSILEYAENDTHAKVSALTFSYNMKGGTAIPAVFTYSEDSTAKFRPVTNEYMIYILPRSSFGAYAFTSKLIFLLLGAAILWQLIKIFQKRTLADPFHLDIIRRLKVLAWLFIIGDFCKLADYFIFNGIAKNLFPSEFFQQLMEFGNGIITGSIIWIVVVVLHRGQELKEENSLTV